MDNAENWCLGARVKVIDDKFKAYKVRYVLQCALATCAVLIVLLILDAMSHTTIIAALGASAFIAFAMPGARASRPRFLIGGYLFGIIAGVLCYYLSVWLPLARWSIGPEFSNALFGAMSVGLATFLMVITNTEHPPAAGLALGFVLNKWDYFTVIVVIVGIVSLSIAKTLLKPLLVDLV